MSRNKDRTIVLVNIRSIEEFAEAIANAKRSRVAAIALMAAAIEHLRGEQ